jgi:NAD(P)-dependent dehydrogenase (short-subunit alcohol dehydrogenase family)
MPLHLRWKLAVVTGGGSGLGRELAVGLARLGVRVVVADRDGDAAEATAGLVRAARVQAFVVQADLTDEDDVRMLAARARDLGGADVLVNNAGGWTPGDAQFPTAPLDAWSRTLDLNLRTPMLLTQLFLADLPTSDDAADTAPAVVNVASSAALGREGYGSPEYAAAKAGLVRLTTALADPATRRRARVMAVVPGWIGLDRAVAEWEALPASQREGLDPLVPPDHVVRVVLDLVSAGHAGRVVELPGGRETRDLAGTGR